MLFFLSAMFSVQLIYVYEHCYFHQLLLYVYSLVQQLQQQQYHVELSSTLYGGGLKTPDAPGGLMTQSMDPSMLLGPLTDGAAAATAFSSSRQVPAMTRSLGPEQLHDALDSTMIPSR